MPNSIIQSPETTQSSQSEQAPPSQRHGGGSTLNTVVQSPKTTTSGRSNWAAVDERTDGAAGALRHWHGLTQARDATALARLHQVLQALLQTAFANGSINAIEIQWSGCEALRRCVLVSETSRSWCCIAWARDEVTMQQALETG